MLRRRFVKGGPQQVMLTEIRERIQKIRQLVCFSSQSQTRFLHDLIYGYVVFGIARDATKSDEEIYVYF